MKLLIILACLLLTLLTLNSCNFESSIDSQRCIASHQHVLCIALPTVYTYTESDKFSVLVCEFVSMCVLYSSQIHASLFQQHHIADLYTGF